MKSNTATVLYEKECTAEGILGELFDELSLNGVLEDFNEKFTRESYQKFKIEIKVEEVK